MNKSPFVVGHHVAGGPAADSDARTAGALLEPARPKARLGRLRILLSSAVAAVLGAVPHVLHHAGPLAGAALLGGVTGSLLFGALGLVAAIPFLLRVRRHTGGWRISVALLVAFAVVFAVSTAISRSAIVGGDEPDRTTAPSTLPPGVSPSEHEAHH